MKCDGCGNELRLVYIEAAVNYNFCMSCVAIGTFDQDGAPVLVDA